MYLSYIYFLNKEVDPCNDTLKSGGGGGEISSVFDRNQSLELCISGPKHNILHNYISKHFETF